MPRETAEDHATMLADMRARLEAATSEIDRLASRLIEREEWIDELETVVDVALGLLDTPVLVVGDDRRIRALSRAARELLGADAVVGKPLSSVVPDDLVRMVDVRLAEGGGSGSGAGSTEAAASVQVDVCVLPKGGAIVVFEGRWSDG